jgi:hypothetical protein
LHDAWLRYLSSPEAAEARQARQARPVSDSGLFPQENGADDPDCERANGDAERATGANGADAERATPSESARNNPTESMAGAGGADGADVPANGRGGAGQKCAQCNAGGEPLEPVAGTDPLVELHPECRRFWFKDHPEADGIPQSLRRSVPPDRRPVLGPPGDTLDDFK